MIGRTNCLGRYNNKLSLNPLCLIDLPLEKNLTNKGILNTNFSLIDENTIRTSPGFNYLGCYKNYSNFNGGIISDSSILLEKEFSFFAWVNFSKLAEINGIMGNYRNYSNTGFNLNIKYIDENSGYLSYSYGVKNIEEPVNKHGQTQLYINNWYHVGCTYDKQGFLTLYLNGKPDGYFYIGDIAGSADFFTLFNWSLDQSNLYCLNGALNSVLVYNKALTANDAEMIFYEFLEEQEISTKQIRFIKCSLFDNDITKITEIEAFDQFGINKALGTIVKESYGDWIHPIYITNGTKSAYQFAEAKENDASIIIDLGANIDISIIKVWIGYGDNLSYNYQLETSIDGNNFETIFNSKNNGSHIETKDGFAIIF